MFFSKQYFSEEYRSRRLQRHTSYLQVEEMAEMAEINEPSQMARGCYMGRLKARN